MISDESPDGRRRSPRRVRGDATIRLGRRSSILEPMCDRVSGGLRHAVDSGSHINGRGERRAERDRSSAGLAGPSLQPSHHYEDWPEIPISATKVRPGKHPAPFVCDQLAVLVLLLGRRVDMMADLVEKYVGEHQVPHERKAEHPTGEAVTD